MTHIESIKEDFLPLFEKDKRPFVIEDGNLRSGPHRFPIRNGIPRFTSDASYSDNFMLLREKHSTLQLDSINGTTHRRDTLMDRTQWPAGFFRGKTVLECGCGAGPDTEILLSLGCRVLAVDLAGVDVAKKNVKNISEVQFLQASIMDLPLRKKSFDFVFCHRVLQHTPDPEATLRHILQFVKDDGAVFVHSYARTFRQLFRSKYFLRPITRRLPGKTLYRLIRQFSRPLFHLTNVTGKTRIGRYFNWVFVPFHNHATAPGFPQMSGKDLFEYCIHDTFDALSPRYDSPISASAMRRIAAAALVQPFEILEQKCITLLRTKLAS